MISIAQALRITQTDWDDQKIWKTYTLLTDLESVFREIV